MNYRYILCSTQKESDALVAYVRGLGSCTTSIDVERVLPRAVKSPDAEDSNAENSNADAYHLLAIYSEYDYSLDKAEQIATAFLTGLRQSP